MNLYQQVSRNKMRSWVLLLTFVALFTFFFYMLGQFYGSPTPYLILGLVISVGSSFASYFYSDKLVLATTGAKPADPNIHFDFYTVAQNIALASGLPEPKLYVMDTPAMNAFATGRDPKHAVVAVTTGLLQHLDRSELEGVIAHEMGHIKNYDIMFSTLVSALVGTLVLVSDWLMRSMMWFGLGGRDSRERNQSPIGLVAVVLTLILAPIAATLIQFAVSRKREYMADATGALVTRNPGALADALEKIAMVKEPVRGASGATAHLFISNPFGSKKVANKLQGLFSTHPPIKERIKILREM